MAYENYDLVTLRTRLAEEFGIDISIAANSNTIDKRINDALAWIVNRRKNWPWQEREIAIDIGEVSASSVDSRYGAGLFVRRQRQITSNYYSQTPASAREFVDFVGNGYDGIMLTNVSGTTLTLEQAHAGASSPSGIAITNISIANPAVVTVTLLDGNGDSVVLPVNTAFPVVIVGNTILGGTEDANGTHQAIRLTDTTFSLVGVDTTATTWNAFGTCTVGNEYRIAQGHFELPEDFIRSDAVHLESDTDWNIVYSRDTTTFKREVRNDKILGGINRIYTIVPDPVNVEPFKYISIYPYFVDRNILHVKYFGDVRKLIGDFDVPDVPRSDRFVVWYAAAWFVAQWQKDADMLAFYRDGALNELERMTKEYQLMDDITEDTTQKEGDIGPVQGPHGFPRFRV